MPRRCRQLRPTPRVHPRAPIVWLSALLLPATFAALSAGTAAAQEPAAPPPALTAANVALGTVRGVVYDSLAGAPLAGARVWSADGLRATLSDSAGRFLLDSVPAAERPTVLLAEHPHADAVGITTLAARARVPAGGTVDVVIAIPSFATLRAAACAGIADAGDEEGGILFGTVRDARDGAPVDGATVSLRWRGIRERPGVAIPEVVEHGLDATADASGSYYACGLPTSFALLARATAGAGTADSVASGEIVTIVGARRIHRRDLLVGAAGATTVIVTVTDSGGRPLRGARVFADEGAPVEATTSGRAVMRGVGAGTRTVGARSIGYTPVELAVDVMAGDTAQVAIRLERAPVVLETVRVRGLIAEIEARAGRGYVTMGEELARKPTLSFAVPMTSNVRNTSKVAGQLSVAVRNRVGNWCSPKVLLDGRLSDQEEVSMYRVDELFAVELYVDFKDAPPEYVRPLDYQCGVMLVWTKRY